jgi:thymidylate kinase
VRRVTTVALIGADGSGKTTLARALERSGELPIKYLYMGVSADSSNHALPTTRALRALKRALGRDKFEGGPPDPAQKRAKQPRRGWKRVAHEAKSTLALANRLAEEWYRVRLARRFERRGFVVLFDRHFYADYWAHDVTASERTFAQRLHARALARLPRPDCTILLDAPAEVLFARKAEGTLELLEQRRQEYLAMQRALGSCTVIDATRPASEIQAEVLALLRDLRARGGVA